MSISDVLFTVSLGFSLAGLLLLIVRWREPGIPHETYGLWALANVAACVGNALIGSTAWATLEGILAIVWGYLWWRGCRKGRMKKAAKALGEKSRARIRALADRLDRSPIPAPGGAQ